MRQDARMSKPYIRVHPLSMKHLNTDTTRVKPHIGKRTDIGLYKDKVNARRVNAETKRVRLARARFVPASRLINHNGNPIAILNPFTGKVIKTKAA